LQLFRVKAIKTAYTPIITYDKSAILVV